MKRRIEYSSSPATDIKMPSSMWNRRKEKYVYIQVIYPLEWGGNTRLCEIGNIAGNLVGRWRHRTCYLPLSRCFANVFLFWSTTSRGSEHVPLADKFSSNRYRSYVAPAKIDANYIVNCSCRPIFYLNSGPICHISIQESQRCRLSRLSIGPIYYKQDDVRLAKAHQIESRVAI